MSKTKGNQSRIKRWKRQEEKARLLLGSHLPPSPSCLLNLRELAQAHSQQAEMSRAPTPRGKDHKMVLTLEKQWWPCVRRVQKRRSKEQASRLSSLPEMVTKAHSHTMGFPGGSAAKNPPAMQEPLETRV